MDFDIAIKLLCDAEVEFVVVGGVSAIFHGAYTLSYVLEICYSRTRLNLHRLVEALAPYHPRPRGFAAKLPFIWDESTLGNTSLLTLQTDFGEIDLLAEISGLGDYEAVKSRSIVVEAYGRHVATLDLPSLIEAKRAAGREKDLRALPELESLLEAEQPES